MPFVFVERSNEIPKERWKKVVGVREKSKRRKEAAARKEPLVRPVA